LSSLQVDDRDAGRNGVFDGLAETVFGFKGLLGSATFPANFGFAQLPAHGRAEAREVVLHHVIVGAGFHGGDGGIVSDVAGNDNEGQVEAAVLDQGEGGQAVEMRHDVVGNHQVPGLLIQGRAHGFAGFDAMADRVIAAALQFYFQQGGIIFRILNDEHLQWITGLAHV
jgi:hypothetical protein